MSYFTPFKTAGFLVVALGLIMDTLSFPCKNTGGMPRIIQRELHSAAGQEP